MRVVTIVRSIVMTIMRSIVMSIALSVVVAILSIAETVVRPVVVARPFSIFAIIAPVVATFVVASVAPARVVEGPLPRIHDRGDQFAVVEDFHEVFVLFGESVTKLGF